MGQVRDWVGPRGFQGYQNLMSRVRVDHVYDAREGYLGSCKIQKYLGNRSCHCLCAYDMRRRDMRVRSLKLSGAFEKTLLHGLMALGWGFQ